MFTGIWLFFGFLAFAVYRRCVTYSPKINRLFPRASAYYFVFYGYLFVLCFEDLAKTWQYEIVDFDWLTATEKFGINHVGREDLIFRVLVWRVLWWML